MQRKATNRVLKFCGGWKGALGGRSSALFVFTSLTMSCTFQEPTQKDNRSRKGGQVAANDKETRRKKKPMQWKWPLCKKVTKRNVKCEQVFSITCKTSGFSFLTQLQLRFLVEVRRLVFKIYPWDARTKCRALVKIYSSCCFLWGQNQQTIMICLVFGYEWRWGGNL